MKSFLPKAIAVLVLFGTAVTQVRAAHESGDKSAIPFTSGFNASTESVSLTGSSVSLFACGAAATLWTGNISVPPSAIPVSLAMADFTGDSHPDVAKIELERFDSSTAHYFIEIQLTEGGHQSLTLTAPARGLVITPKDVTGDGTLDLVVRAIGSEIPVAVFINDGCGHFSAGEPAPFARALQDVPTESGFTSARQFLGAAVTALSSHTIACRDCSRRSLQEQRSSPLSANGGGPSSRLFSPFGANRAPPTAA